MAGAFQLALTSGSAAGQRTNAVPKDVLGPGSLEEDHVRRHSSYLSDGPRQWLVALGVILRGVAGSLVVIGLMVALLGIATGWFYRVTQIADLGQLRRFLLPGVAAPTKAPAFVVPTAGVTLVIAVVGGVAILAYLLRVFWESSSGHSAGALTQASNAAAGAALFFGIVGTGLPAIVWASVRLTWDAEEVGAMKPSGAHAFGARRERRHRNPFRPRTRFHSALYDPLSRPLRVREVVPCFWLRGGPKLVASDTGA